MEGDFLTKGIHISVSDDEKDDIKGLRHKRKEIFSSGERRRKEGKTSNKEMLDKIVSILSDSMSQRTTTSIARERGQCGMSHCFKMHYRPRAISCKPLIQPNQARKQIKIAPYI